MKEQNKPQQSAIEQQMLWAISNNCQTDDKHGIDSAASACASIAEQNAIEFAEWIEERCFGASDVFGKGENLKLGEWLYVTETDVCVWEKKTTSELYQLFKDRK